MELPEGENDKKSRKGKVKAEAEEPCISYVFFQGSFLRGIASCVLYPGGYLRK